MNERIKIDPVSALDSGTVVAESRFSSLRTNQVTRCWENYTMQIQIRIKKIMCGSSGLQVNLIISFIQFRFYHITRLNQTFSQVSFNSFLLAFCQMSNLIKFCCQFLFHFISKEKAFPFCNPRKTENFFSLNITSFMLKIFQLYLNLIS